MPEGDKYCIRWDESGAAGHEPSSVDATAVHGRRVDVCVCVLP